MLKNLNRKSWSTGLTLTSFTSSAKASGKVIKDMAALAEGYNTRIEEEEGKTTEEIVVANVGKVCSVSGPLHPRVSVPPWMLGYSQPKQYGDARSPSSMGILAAQAVWGYSQPKEYGDTPGRCIPLHDIDHEWFASDPSPEYGSLL